MKTVPYRGYVDQSRPLAETSVFSAFDDRGPSTLTVYISSLDGVPYKCAAGNPGCSFWFRVAPGEHKIGLRYMNMNGGLSSYQNANTVITVDMAPKTIYVARVSVSNDTIKIDPLPLSPNEGYKFPAMHEGSVQGLFGK